MIPTQGIDLFFNMPVNKELQEFKLTDVDWELLGAIGTVLEVASIGSGPHIALSRFPGPSPGPAAHVF